MKIILPFFLLCFFQETRAQQCYFGTFRPFLSSNQFYAEHRGDTVYVSQFIIVASRTYSDFSDTLVQVASQYIGRKMSGYFADSKFFLKGMSSTPYKKVRTSLHRTEDCKNELIRMKKSVLWDSYDFSGLSFQQQRNAALEYESLSVDEATIFLSGLKK